MQSAITMQSIVLLTFPSLVKAPKYGCDISLCTATTDVDKPVVQCTWKLSSQTARMRQPTFGGGLVPFSKAKELSQSMNLVQVEEKNGSSFGKSGSKFVGVTFGIANLLFQSQQPLSGHSLSMSVVGGISEERGDEERGDLESLGRCDSDSAHRSSCDSDTTKKSEYLIVGKRSVSCTFSATDESSSIEVCMPPISEGYELGFRDDDDNKQFLYEKVRLAEESFVKEEAMLEDQKRLVREKQLADEVQLVEMTRETKAAHLQKSKLLTKLAIEAANAEQERNEEEVKLSVSLQNILQKLEEERKMFKTIRLEEEKNLENEEKGLAEKRRLLEEAYKMEQVRLLSLTRKAEERLLNRARLAEERQCAEQAKLNALTHRVEEARVRADDARFLVEQEVRYMESLTFDDTFSLAPSISMAPSKLNALTGEKSWDQQDTSAEIAQGESLHSDHWDELDASKFDVRGNNYLVDRQKISSAPNLLRLMAVDLLEVDEPLMDGFCSHPKGRVSSRVVLSITNITLFKLLTLCHHE